MVVVGGADLLAPVGWWLTLCGSAWSFMFSRACESSACMLSLGLNSFMCSASSIAEHLASVHTCKISVFSSRSFLVILMLCCCYKCILGTPYVKWQVVCQDSFIVVMPM